MAGDSWAFMPSVLIVEILSYLSQSDRLNASSVCIRWRSCLFQSKLWRTLSLNLHRSNKERTNFLTDICGRFARKCAVTFNPHNIDEVKTCMNVLDVLAININLQVFELKPSSCHFQFIDRLENVIQSCRRLKHISLGCSEDLQAHSNALFESLASRHSVSLEALHIASVKEDSENYGIIDLKVDLFQNFSCLKHLSIDFDFVDSRLLAAFCKNGKPGLEKLVIHVHGIEPDHEIIPNSLWQQFTSYNKNVKVTLNLMHSIAGVQKLVDILKPDLPLQHYRQFFCTQLSTAAIGLMGNQYSRTLKSVHIVDGMEFGFPAWYNISTNEDPFVMLAWKCPHLSRLTLIGYEVADEDIVAIARLRSDSLESLDIPDACIRWETSHDTHIIGGVQPEFTDKVSESLGRRWRPLEDSQLPQAVWDSWADAEEAYSHILLSDQAYSHTA
ncbi:FBX33-like protein [Mya arenaria]|uniref:FBX33-like protein n=1 Tax=Mya arenaria TaxID=6604 RepID=A0ABY7DU34_MYAAR|nr:FBX33-like protein [Mya arenaria]